MKNEPKTPHTTRTPMLPRDGAGSFKVPATVPGPITEMCGLRDRLELYTAHETFMLQTPETIDPERTNPNAMFVNARTHSVGSASPFVAKTIIMASKALNGGPFDEERREAILTRMHAIKELLLQCKAAADEITASIEAEIAAVEGTEFRLAPGARSLERFPVVPNLDGTLTMFLIAARRAVTEICQLAGHFWKLARPHSNTEHLSTELESLLGSSHPVVDYLRSWTPATKAIVELRNGQEHSGTGRKTIVRNFFFTPSGQLSRPVWHLEGDQPSDLGIDLKAFPEMLLNFAECMFVHCVAANLPEWPPYAFSESPNPNPECPVRYELTIDLSRFQTELPVKPPPEAPATT